MLQGGDQRCLILMSLQKELQKPGSLLAGLSGDEHHCLPAWEFHRYRGAEQGFAPSRLLPCPVCPATLLPGTCPQAEEEGAELEASSRYRYCAVPILCSPSPGKYSSDLSPAFLLNLPYILIPIWAGMRLFQQPKALPCLSPEKVSWELRQELCGSHHPYPCARAGPQGVGPNPGHFPSPRWQRSSGSACTSGPRTWGWSWSCSSLLRSPSSGGW